jgi:hypothetical protein
MSRLQPPLSTRTAAPVRTRVAASARWASMGRALMPTDPTATAARHLTSDYLEAVKMYDGKANNYNVALDPRCLFGWGPPDRCSCMFGHACFRPLGHPGKCWDGGNRPPKGEKACFQRQRPKDWDAKGRAESNR